MAYDYEKSKKLYEQLNDEQKEQFANSNSWNAQKFLQQYNQEKNNQTPTSNESNFNNQNGTNWQNTTQTPTTNKTENQNNTPTVIPSENAQNAYKTLRSMWYGSQNNPDSLWGEVSPDLDQSKFNEAPWKITVQEWTAKETGKPDYQLSSEARLNEMKSNLDQYFKDSPRMFNDRETFNKVFEYNTRESEAQRQLLDSYWKRKEDMDKASTYTSWEAINNWMKNWEITTDQLNLLKEYNPEAYQKWQQLQEDEIMKRIVNDIVPKTVEEISWKINSMIEALWIQAQDALDIEWIYNDTMAKTWAYQTLEDCNRTVKQIEEVINKKTAIMNRCANSTWWTVSAALAAARMAKAIAPYNEQLQGLQYQYQDYANLYSQKTATATQAANVRAMQAQENQRIWNQKCSALGFATSALSYRTPEETLQNNLKVQQAQNEMALLQQSKQNDLALYNAYATAKLNNQLSYELTDLSVEDPAQLKANLNNVLSSYYSQWGDIIQRPQAQVVEDVLAYAQKNGVSVAEALKKNFIEPLQSKQEYKNKIASSYAAPTSASSAGYSKITINWKDYLTMGWKIIDPATLWIWTWDTTNTKPYNLVSVETMENWIDAFSIGKNQGDYYWECWKFVNDYLVSIWVTDANNRYFGNETIDTRRQRCNTQTAAKWAVAVFDYGIISSDNKNHGHVAIVTDTYEDWSFDVIESNYPSGWKINVKRHVEKNDPALQWFINYSLWASSTQWYNIQEPYSWTSGYTNTGAEINAWWWIKSLESHYMNWFKDKDERKSTLEKYGIDEKVYNEQQQRFLDYYEFNTVKSQLETLKKSAEAIVAYETEIWDTDYHEWFWDNATIYQIDEPWTSKGADFWYSLFWESWASTEYMMFKNFMSDASFQKYLDMKDAWAQFWIMTDSEWRKIDASTAPITWGMNKSEFVKAMNTRIEVINEDIRKINEKYGYSSAEDTKPETAEQVEVIPNSWVWSWDIITMVIDGVTRYSYDWGKTRH